MWKYIKSLRTKILVSFVLVFIIPTLFGLYFASSLITERIQIALKETLSKNALLVRNKLTNYERVAVMTDLFATNEELRTKIFLKREHQVRFLAKLMKEESGAEYLSILNDKFEPLAIIGTDLNILPKREKEVSILRSGNSLYLYSRTPIIDSNVFLGVLQIAFLLNDSILKELEPLVQSDIYIISGGNVIASTDSDSDPAIIMALNNVNTPDFFSINHSLKGSLMAMYVPIYDINSQQVGSIVAALPDRDIHLAFTRTKKNFFKIGALLILLAVVLAILFSGQIVHPIRNLSNLLTHATSGDLSRRAEIYSNDEIGELAMSFNLMSEKLESAQQTLLQTEKLASVGKLASGMSHEINNPLVSILGYSELAQEHLDNSEKLKTYLERINRDALRCKQIIDQLLTFAREKQKEYKEIINVSAIVEDVILLTDHILKTKNILVKLFKDDSDPRVYVSIDPLKRVFINLISNAIDAMDNNGTLTIRIKKVINDKGMEYAYICFEDNGGGISPDVLSRIFDPFFTTKDVGKGTGLGLSLSYGIIQDHGGTIEVESTLGKGTIFTVKLPAKG